MATGHVDSNAPHTVDDAWSAGFAHVDIYVSKISDTIIERFFSNFDYKIQTNISNSFFLAQHAVTLLDKSNKLSTLCLAITLTTECSG